MEKVNLIAPAVTRQALVNIETAAKAEGAELPWEELTTHHFGPGVYVRQFDLPADSLVIGKIHKHSHLNMLMVGVVTVASEFHTETFAAPRVWVSEPGIKRAVYTLKDAMWLTVHPNPGNTQDMDEIEDEVIAPTYEQLDCFLKGQLEKI